MSENLRQQTVYIDRTYLSSNLVRERSDDLEIYCKAWPVRASKRFSRQTFTLIGSDRLSAIRLNRGCPLCLVGVVHFPKEVCTQRPLKEQCITSGKGRSVSIHPDEALLIELRQHQQTPQGRARLRERVAVEHTLAHIGQWQGRRARY